MDLSVLPGENKQILICSPQTHMLACTIQKLES